jgi:hypothetical protein
VNYNKLSLKEALYLRIYNLTGNATNDTENLICVSIKVLGV